ncbi:hypothetical protein ARC310_15770, partial [Pantoea ananatis]
IGSDVLAPLTRYLRVVRQPDEPAETVLPVPAPLFARVLRANSGFLALLSAANCLFRSRGGGQ